MADNSKQLKQREKRRRRREEKRANWVLLVDETGLQSAIATAIQSKEEKDGPASPRDPPKKRHKLNQLERATLYLRGLVAQEADYESLKREGEDTDSNTARFPRATAFIDEARKKMAARIYESMDLDEMRKWQLQLEYQTHYNFLKHTRRLVSKAKKVEAAGAAFSKQSTVAGLGSENEPEQAKKDLDLIIGVQILSYLIDGMEDVLKSGAERRTPAADLLAKHRQICKEWDWQRQLPTRLMELLKRPLDDLLRNAMLGLEKDVKEMTESFMRENSHLKLATKEDGSWNTYRELMGLPRVAMFLKLQRQLAGRTRRLTAIILSYSQVSCGTPP